MYLWPPSWGSKAAVNSYIDHRHLFVWNLDSQISGRRQEDSSTVLCDIVDNTGRVCLLSVDSRKFVLRIHRLARTLMVASGAGPLGPLVCWTRVYPYSPPPLSVLDNSIIIVCFALTATFHARNLTKVMDTSDFRPNYSDGVNQKGTEALLGIQSKGNFRLECTDQGGHLPGRNYCRSCCSRSRFIFRLTSPLV